MMQDMMMGSGMWEGLNRDPGSPRAHPRVGGSRQIRDFQMTSAIGGTRGHEASSAWLRGLRVYLVTIAIGNLVWEGLHLPLYTIWSTGTLREQAFAVAHCTLGDLSIALSTLTLALVLAGGHGWPRERFWPVAVLTVIFGVGYTMFSEWLNVVVRASWAYSERMPVISLFGLHIGLSPFLQWIVVPAVAFKIARGNATKQVNGGQQ
jgi:hypothetical protein